MNAAERFLDALHPRLSVRLRLLKKRWRQDGVLDVVNAVVGTGDVVVDIGAHRGVYTCRLSQLVGPEGRVHAVEPVPENLAFVRSLAATRANVIVHAVAASDHAGDASLFIPRFRGRRMAALASLSAPTVDHEIVTVPLVPLDDLVGSETGRVAYVKCDAEGHELAALRGADGILRRWMPVLSVRIEQRHQRDGGTIDATFRHLHALGYAGSFLTPRGLRPLSEFDVESHQLRFLHDDFVPYDMPRDYVLDFVFVDAAGELPAGLQRASGHTGGGPG